MTEVPTSSDLVHPERLEIDTLDPRDEEKEFRGEPIEDLEDLILDPSHPDQVLKISNQLSPDSKSEPSHCLRANSDVFA